jgi:alkaline phosphatase D
MKLLLSFLTGFIFSLNAFAQDSHQHPAQLLSGPMVGHTTSSGANIWIETDKPTEVDVHFWVESGSRPIEKNVATGRTNEDEPHTGVVELNNLPAGGTVHYELVIDGRPIRPQSIQSFTLLPEADSFVDFKVAFASCMNPSRIPLQPIWTQVAVFDPDAFFLIGDNNYMPNRAEEYETSESTVKFAMGRYHRYLRDIPGLRTVLATTPTYGIWDDHDFGPNNSDRTFKWKDLSLDLFKKYWPNPSAGTSDTPGIFYSFKIADVEFFMMDDRYHRDPNNAPDRKTMLGEGQLAWLKNQLQASTATFKVIVNGHTMSIDRKGSGEYWANFGTEREDFLNWMFSEHIDGVFFLSGDWHVGSLSRVDFSDEGYPLYELISSNAGVHPVEADADQYKRNRTVTGHNRNFDGPIVNDLDEYNFGLLEFSGDENNRTVTLKLIDHRGEVRVAHLLSQDDLRKM